MAPSRHSDNQTRSRVRRALAGLAFWTALPPLVFLLLLQGLLLLRGSLEVPEPALARLHQELEQRGWEASFRNLRYLPPATLIINHLQLGPPGEEPMISAEVGRLDLSLPALIRGAIEIQAFTLYGGSLYCPAPWSPTGLREPILQRTHLVASPVAGGWAIQNLNGEVQGVRVSAVGLLPHLPRQEIEPVAWEELLATVLPQLVRERALLHQVTNPHLGLRFNPAPQGGLIVEAELTADAVAAPHAVRVIEPRLTTRWLYDGERWRGETALLELATVAWDRIAMARALAVELHWAPDEAAAWLPVKADFSVAEVRNPDGCFAGLSGSVSRTGATGLEIDFFSLFENDPVGGRADFDWSTGTGSLELAARINPTPLLGGEIARELGLNRRIAFEEAPFLRAMAEVEAWQFVRAWGWAHARAADIDGVLMDRASAWAELRPDRFIVPEMVLAFEDFEAEGSYEIEFHSKAYRLQFEGGVRPLHIRAWFREWWETLWGEFSFAEGPLRGDIDIHGVLGRPREVTLFGSVGAENFSLREVPFNRVRGMLRLVGSEVDFSDLVVVRPEGTATGGFRYSYNPEERSWEKVEFHADSTIDPAAVAPVFGEEGRQMLNSFRFTGGPPVLSLDGVVYAPPRGEDSRILIRGETAAPLEYQGLPLTRLEVKGGIEGTAWRLSEITAGLAGGTVSGNAQRWRESETDRLGFTFFLRGLNLERTLDAAAAWRAAAGLEEIQARRMKGIVDLYLDASGEYGDFSSFTGEGSVRIQEADLAEVHLLGILSRILSVTPLGFTSLQFNEADAQFRLSRDKLHFQNLQLTGPTSAIRAAGDYVIDENALDMSLRVYLLKETKIPLLSLLLSPLLEPLAHVMEIRVSGPVADPDWRFLLGPRNILRTISSGESESEPDD